MRTQILAYCVVGLSFFSANVKADDSEQIMLVQNTQNRMLLAIPQKHFDELEEMAETFRSQRTRKPNGGWLLDDYYGAIDVLVDDETADRKFADYSKLIDEWRAAYPNSPTPIIAKAELLVDYGWHLRGGGYANTVFKNQWKMFGEKLHEAFELINTAPESVKQDPRWYSLSVRILRGLGGDPASVKRLVLEGIKREPGYYRTYIEYMTSLTPNWGGSYEAMDDWIEEASSIPEAKVAYGLYARMYWNAREELGRTEFAYLNIDWKRMTQETDVVLEHDPSVSNLEAAMWFSCQTRSAEEVLKRYAAIRKVAPSLESNIIPAEYCRWSSVLRRDPEVINPNEINPQSGPQRASK